MVSDAWTASGASVVSDEWTASGALKLQDGSMVLGGSMEWGGASVLDATCCPPKVVLRQRVASSPLQRATSL
jgi:hypothetical protein